MKKAYEVLDDETTRAKCMEIVEEAEGRTKMAMEEKRKQLRKQGHKVREGGSKKSTSFTLKWSFRIPSSKRTTPSSTSSR